MFVCKKSNRCITRCKIIGLLNDAIRDCMRSPYVCPSKLGSRMARRYTKTGPLRKKKSGFLYSMTEKAISYISLASTVFLM